MSSQGGRGRVLRFAVTGALLGGGAAVGCAGNDQPRTNTAPVIEPPDVDPGDEPEPEPEPVNEPPIEPVEPPIEPDHVNEGPIEPPLAPERDGLAPKPEPKRVNVAKEPEPKPRPGMKVNPGPAN